jgi:hypothetical protein
VKLKVVNIKEATGCIHLELVLFEDDGRQENADVFIDLWNHVGRWTHKHPSDGSAMPITNEKIIEDVVRAMFQYRDKVLDDIKSITDVTSKYLSKDTYVPEIHDGYEYQFPNGIPKT